MAAVTITSPQNGATVASPVHCVAYATSGHPIQTLKIYVDYKSVYTVASNSLDTYLTLAAGSHRFVVQAWDASGNIFKKVETITVSSSSTPTPPPVAVSISPSTAVLQASNNQQFTASVTGTTNTGVSWRVNGVAGGNSTVGTISATGLYAAPAVSANTSVTVSAVSSADTTKSGNASVTVTAPATPPPSSASGPYGSGIGGDSLANTQVGGTDCGCGSMGARTAYRFRAATSSTLNSIRIFFQDGTGYSGGNGGQIRIELQTDDNSSNHFPSGSVLASATVAPGNPVSNHWPQISFSSTPQLTVGQLYHIVFSNVDSSPTTNFMSVNGVYNSSATTPRQPKFADSDWAQLLNTGGSWTMRSQYTPVLELNYGDGTIDGVGYMESWISGKQSISGSSKVGEVLTVSEANLAVSGVAIRVAHTSGSSGLTLRLEDANGNLIDQGTVPASSVGSGMSWVTANFSSRHTLNQGQSYRLVVTSPSDSVYSTFPLRDGTGFGFIKGTVFADGFAQVNNGSGWVGWTMWGQSNRTDGDLQFYFLP